MTPSERLEQRLLATSCKLCTFLGSLDEVMRREWQKAIANPRYAAKAIASILGEDGATISDTTVRKHRERGHK